MSFSSHEKTEIQFLQAVVNEFFDAQVCLDQLIINLRKIKLEMSNLTGNISKIQFDEKLGFFYDGYNLVQLDKLEKTLKNFTTNLLSSHYKSKEQISNELMKNERAIQHLLSMPSFLILKESEKIYENTTGLFENFHSFLESVEVIESKIRFIRAQKTKKENASEILQNEIKSEIFSKVSSELNELNQNLWFAAKSPNMTEVIDDLSQEFSLSMSKIFGHTKLLKNQLNQSPKWMQKIIFQALAYQPSTYQFSSLGVVINQSQIGIMGIKLKSDQFNSIVNQESNNSTILYKSAPQQFQKRIDQAVTFLSQ